MSLHLPARRALGTAPTILKTLRPTALPPTTTTSAISPCLLLVAGQVRHAATTKNTKSVTHAARGVVNRQKPKDLHKTLLGDLAKSEDRQGVEDTLRGRMSATRLESQSIFDEELKNVGQEDGDASDAPLASDAAAKALRERKTQMGASRLADHMRIAVDPDPRSRRRWERKMVIQRVTRALDVRGKETREERLKRTEREALSKSEWLATSVKKLMHLARQISGKTLEEARTQMKFSKKKFAKEVLYELDLARDKAVVERGMGLGKANGEFVPGETEKKTIRDHRHGKWVDVVDPTRLYVHEAWVNRGPWRGKRPNYRAKGRTDVIKMPQASITIRLKEEKSRVREHEEKKAKEYRQGPWIHLPDRPVTAQRPFYTW